MLAYQSFASSTHGEVAHKSSSHGCDAVAPGSTCAGHLPGVPVATCFAPGTSEEYMEKVSQRLFEIWKSNPTSEIQPPGSQYYTTTRWSGSTGTPREITWSFVPDGLSISNGIGEGTAPSNLFATLDSQFSNNGGRAVWIEKFQRIFDRWAALTGTSYRRITSGGNEWDDGASWGSAGSAGRGDVRISMKRIDGRNGVLAYNFFPSNGDMVIDSGELWDSTTNDFRFLRNTLAHEHGHGVGVLHVCPTNGTKMMEPALATAFDMLQHDDIRAGHFLYGDALEENDAVGQASNLGALVNNTQLLLGPVPPPNVNNGSIISLNNSTDVDWYAFTVNGPTALDVTIAPVGLNYDSSPQNSNGSCASGRFVDSRNISDLRFEVIDRNGTTVLSSVNNQGLGGTETVNDVNLPVAGTYYVRVLAASGTNASQLYNLTLFPTAGQGGGGSETEVLPFVYFVEPGRGTELTTNDVNLIRTDDDVNARVRNQLQTSAGLPNVSVVATGFVEPGPADSILVQLRSTCTGATGGNIRQRVEAFNYVSNSWVVLLPNDFVPGTGEQLVERTIDTNAGEFISPDGDVSVRLRWFDRGAPSPGWESRIDQVRWVVTR